MKATRTRKVQTNKANYMSDEAFADLKEAMEALLLLSAASGASLKVTSNPSSATAKGNVAQRHCSDTRKAQLLSGRFGNDDEH